MVPLIVTWAIPLLMGFSRGIASNQMQANGFRIGGVGCGYYLDHLVVC